MRRLTMTHGIVSFVFNTAILALMINIGAGSRREAGAKSHLARRTRKLLKRACPHPSSAASSPASGTRMILIVEKAVCGTL